MKPSALLRTAAMAIGLSALSLAPLANEAGAYPTKPINVVVAFAPGGMTDMLGRLFAKALQEELKQPVVVENRAGASGQIASAHVAKSSPDGYTLLVTATHHVINHAIQPNLPYDTRKDFVPIAKLGSTPNVLLVHPALPVKDLKEFLAYAKKQPGGVQVATSGVGGSTHLSAVLLSLMTDTPILHVPYKGIAPATSDLLGQHVPSVFGDLQSMSPFIRDGRVRVLGVSSLQRHPVIPDVPTIAEQGVAGFEGISFMGLYGPAALPRSVVETLNRVAVKAMNSAEVLEVLAANGGSPGKMTQAEFATYINSELEKWSRVVKDGNIKPN